MDSTSGLNMRRIACTRNRCADPATVLMFSQENKHSSAHLWFINSLETYLVIFEPLSINFTAQRDLSSTHCANTTKPNAPATSAGCCRTFGLPPISKQGRRHRDAQES